MGTNQAYTSPELAESHVKVEHKKLLSSRTQQLVILIATERQA
jgi:hypothetical protein